VCPWVTKRYVERAEVDPLESQQKFTYYPHMDAPPGAGPGQRISLPLRSRGGRLGHLVHARRPAAGRHPPQQQAACPSARPARTTRGLSQTPLSRWPGSTSCRTPCGMALWQPSCSLTALAPTSATPWRRTALALFASDTASPPEGLLLADIRIADGHADAQALSSGCPRTVQLRQLC
jgi:hypothetical protein